MPRPVCHAVLLVLAPICSLLLPPTAAIADVGVGTAPIAGAELLLDGTREMLDEKWTYWQGPRFSSAMPIKWKVVDDPVDDGTAIMTDDPAAAGGKYGSADIVTKKKYRDFRLHVEFAIMNEGGNSGVYLQNRYEIQVLDGDKTAHGMAAVINEAAADYTPYNGVGKWNAYDIVFRAARFKDGKRTHRALVTLYFNGKKVHDNVGIRRVWGGPNSGIDGSNDDNGVGITDTPGGIKLQAEGHDVRYRNVWIKELELTQPNTDLAVDAVLPRATPESQGISSKDLLAFVTEADETIDSMNSVMLVRHGHVVTEGWWAPYARNDQHMLYSLSKSFTSTAVGMAIAEGKLSLTDRVVDFFPEHSPAQPSNYLKSMRIRDLLTMATGHSNKDIGSFSFGADGSLTKAFLAMDVPHKPGTHFCYNTAATYVCSAIVQKVTGQTVVDYLRPRLFDPLRIQDPYWTTSAEGISMGGFGLNLRTSDIASFGQLYLQNGRWLGKQIVPTDWVEMATSRQMSNGSNPESDWEQGYGFQFWRCRNGHYRGDGAHGQFCIVMPKHDAVLAITSGTRNMGSVMSLAWKHLLPAFQNQPLPEDAHEAGRLTAKLASLQLSRPKGQRISKNAAAISDQTYTYTDNSTGTKSIRFHFDQNDVTLTIGDPHGAHDFTVSTDQWNRSRSDAISAIDLRRVARPEDQGYSATGAWTSDDTFEVKLVLTETPYYQNLKFNFSGDEVNVEGTYNLSRGEDHPLVGTATR